MGNTEKTTEYQDYIDYTMERLGFSGPITDESLVSDFIDSDLYDGDVLNDNGVKYMEHLGNNLGISISPEDHIWEVMDRVAAQMSAS
jgi:hypothetical protein